MISISQKPSNVQLVSVSDKDWDMIEMEAKHMNNHFFSLNDIPDKTWLVDGLIGEKEVGIFYGKSGVGKTFIILDLLLSCADGQPFAKRFSVSRPLTVAIAAGEGGLALKKRIQAGIAYKGTQDRGNAYLFMNGIRFYEEGHVESFIEEWKRFKDKPLDILVVDTLSAAMGSGDDASGREMGVVFEKARLLVRELGCSVIFVHHPRKNDDEFRGSSKIISDVDFMVQVDAKAIKCRKLKDAEMFPPVSFELQKFNDSLVVKWSDGSLQEQILTYVEDRGCPVEVSEITRGLRSEASHMTIRNVVKEMAQSGLLKSSLRNPSAKGSSRNPTIYFLNSEVTEVDEW